MLMLPLVTWRTCWSSCCHWLQGGCADIHVAVGYMEDVLIFMLPLVTGRTCWYSCCHWLQEGHADIHVAVGYREDVLIFMLPLVTGQMCWYSCCHWLQGGHADIHVAIGYRADVLIFMLPLVTGRTCWYSCCRWLQGGCADIPDGPGGDRLGGAVDTWRLPLPAVQPTSTRRLSPVRRSASTTTAQGLPAHTTGQSAQAYGGDTLFTLWTEIAVMVF